MGKEKPSKPPPPPGKPGEGPWRSGRIVQESVTPPGTGKPSGEKKG